MTLQYMLLVKSKISHWKCFVFKSVLLFLYFYYVYFFSCISKLQFIHRELNQTYLSNLGVKMLDGYSDPYTERPVTMGEIGCFLSHYFIWQDVIQNNHERILIFEDDQRFQPYFHQKLQHVLYQAHSSYVDWELL